MRILHTMSRSAVVPIRGLEQSRSAERYPRRGPQTSRTLLLAIMDNLLPLSEDYLSAERKQQNHSNTTHEFLAPRAFYIYRFGGA
jgi:hypothetical protein